ncbi:MAG: hypothetical protein ACOCP4_05080 [Candidatus Woesearchaeota archaeon]
MELEKKLELLQVDFWSNEDIKHFFELSDSVVKKIKKNIVIQEGYERIPKNIQTDLIFNMLKVDLDTELKMILLEIRATYFKGGVNG